MTDTSPDRVDLLTEPLDLDGGPGLEFGPLHRCIVDKTRADVRYIDHLDTEGLREKYRSHPHVECAQICEIDFVIDGSPLIDLVGSGYAYVIASHVAEHVPDLIGWLGEIAEVLSTGGIVALALPDKRMSFDAARPLTRPSALIGAHIGGRTKPTPEQVAEHHLLALRCGEKIAWNEVVPRSELAHVHDLGFALDQTRLAAKGDYVDVHCWTFTPQSFVHTLRVLRSCGLTRFVPIAEPVSIGDEFLVHLRIDDSQGAPLPDDWDSAFADVGSPAGHPAGDPSKDLAHDSSADALAALRGSTSWRITAPLRHLGTAARSVARRLPRNNRRQNL